MFCLTLEPSHVNYIKSLSYLPVGLGDKKFPENCFTDKTGKNIADKNKYYGEYTFHYWIWKNYINSLNQSDWIGFCQYRKFWTQNNISTTSLNLESIKYNVLKEIPKNKKWYEKVALFFDDLKGTDKESLDWSSLFRYYVFRKI